jgi:hypothetical protein
MHHRNLKYCALAPCNLALSSVFLNCRHHPDENPYSYCWLWLDDRIVGSSSFYLGAIALIVLLRCIRGGGGRFSALSYFILTQEFGSFHKSLQVIAFSNSFFIHRDIKIVVI